MLKPEHLAGAIDGRQQLAGWFGYIVNAWRFQAIVAVATGRRFGLAKMGEKGDAATA